MIRAGTRASGDGLGRWLKPSSLLRAAGGEGGRCFFEIAPGKRLDVLIQRWSPFGPSARAGPTPLSLRAKDSRMRSNWPVFFDTGLEQDKSGNNPWPTTSTVSGAALFSLLAEHAGGWQLEVGRAACTYSTRVSTLYLYLRYYLTKVVPYYRGPWLYRSSKPLSFPMHVSCSVHVSPSFHHQRRVLRSHKKKSE